MHSYMWIVRFRTHHQMNPCFTFWLIHEKFKCHLSLLLSGKSCCCMRFFPCFFMGLWSLRKSVTNFIHASRKDQMRPNIRNIFTNFRWAFFTIYFKVDFYQGCWSNGNHSWEILIKLSPAGEGCERALVICGVRYLWNQRHLRSFRTAGIVEKAFLWVFVASSAYLPCKVFPMVSLCAFLKSCFLWIVWCLNSLCRLIKI